MSSKITRAYLIGKDLHLRCDCMGKDDPDVVYGVDAKFTPKDAVPIFKAYHEANCLKCKEAKPPIVTELPELVEP